MSSCNYPDCRGAGCAQDPKACQSLPPVRSEPLLAEAIAAIKDLVEALECYTSVHGADEDDEQALALGRDVLRKANNSLTVSPDAKREANTSGGIGSP